MGFDMHAVDKLWGLKLATHLVTNCKTLPKELMEFGVQHHKHTRILAGSACAELRRAP